MDDLILRSTMLSHMEDLPTWHDGNCLDREDVISSVENAPAVDAGPTWISVKDRLPNNRDALKYFLCRCILDGDNSERWAFYQVLRWYVYDINDDGGYYRPHFQEDGYNGMSVTHWMPLPEPPKEN